MNQSDNPRAFICHSSKDKKRFVIDFAERLIGRGIDAWVDKWEMRIGDSLIRRIFDEGIDKCEFFIIILSKNSIKSKWVKQELDVAAVKRIEEETRILPIIIDDNIKIPSVLTATVWKKISNLKSYDDEFEDIVNSILGISDKPELGELPKYAIEMTTIGDLSQIDSTILKMIIEYMFEINKWSRLVSGLQLENLWKEKEISREQVEESLEILNDEVYIIMHLTSGGWFGSPFQLTTSAIIEYAENYIEGFDQKYIGIISNIINENIMQSDVLAKKAGLHIIIVNSLIKEWEEHGYFPWISNYGGDGIVSFQKISASGKRYFKEQLSQ